VGPRAAFARFSHVLMAGVGTRSNRGRWPKVWAIGLLGGLLGPVWLSAHSPDVSGLIFYEEQGQRYVLLKSALTAFEGEINYRFGKEAYSTPQEFTDLVVQHFKDQCILVLNGDTVHWSEVGVHLGHETSLRATLDRPAGPIRSLFVRQGFFANTPGNQCAFVLQGPDATSGQWLLNEYNEHELHLKADSGQWVQTTREIPFGFWVAVVLILSIALWMGVRTFRMG